MTDTSEYVEVIERRSAAATVFLTCEHASALLPVPYRWPEEDAWLKDSHWAFDLGAAELTRELANELGAAAVLSRFSRLLVDPNRSETAADLFRATAEGRPIVLNRHIAGEDRARRLSMARSYHGAIDRELSRDPAPFILSVHSFTPVYEGTTRSVEAGVLFDEEEELSTALLAALAAAGFRAALNEPYSGKLGLIYSAERHAKQRGRRAVELELRQDLASDPAARTRIITVLRDALCAFCTSP